MIVPLVLVSHPSLPPRTLKELIPFVRARANQLNYGTGSVGSDPHLAMELFLSMTGLKVTHVPYRGIGPAMTDLIGGHLHLMMANFLTALPHIKNGRARAFGLSSSKRSSVAPEIPTIAEAGVPGYAVDQWFGVIAPAGTPREVIARLHTATVNALKDPQVRQRFLADGGETVGNSLTPLQELSGTLTPADLHFERHHAGIPTIDPLRHELVIHGLVERPMVFSMEDLQRLGKALADVLRADAEAARAIPAQELADLFDAEKAFGGAPAMIARTLAEWQAVRIT